MYTICLYNCRQEKKKKVQPTRKRGNIRYMPGGTLPWCTSTLPTPFLSCITYTVNYYHHTHTHTHTHPAAPPFKIHSVIQRQDKPRWSASRVILSQLQQPQPESKPQHTGHKCSRHQHIIIIKLNHSMKLTAQNSTRKKVMHEFMKAAMAPSGQVNSVVLMWNVMF